MNFITRTIPKDGMLPDENEDAFFISENKLIFAIADGATESSFSKQWANYLVEDFVSEHNTYLNNNAILPCKKIETLIEEMILTKKLPWYAEEKAKMGANAAFLGIAFNHSPETTEIEWQTCALGDCNLFIIRNNSLIQTFPIINSNEFSNHPCLINSQMKFQHQKNYPFKTSKGKLIKGDIFFLMTDAIAKWFLESIEKVGPNSKDDTPLKIIEFMISNEENFAKTTMELRESKKLRNDDTTIVKISF